MPSVDIRFYEELNDFLPVFRRGQRWTAPLAEGCTAKALIEDVGVPHTEVDLILANGQSVSFSYRPRDGDRLSVYPTFEAFDIGDLTRLRPEPLRHVRFVLDVHLGKLARLLRMLGLDAAYSPSASDAELARVSADEARALLTRDRGLLKRSIVTHGYCVRSSLPPEQVAEVLRRFDCARQVAPFARCMKCNEQLRRADQNEVQGKVPAHIAATIPEFSLCQKCGRIYWKGTHWVEMRKQAAKILDGTPGSR
jgi:uncharacterized protein